MVIQVLRPFDLSASFSFWRCPLILMNRRVIEALSLSFIRSFLWPESIVSRGGPNCFAGHIPNAATDAEFCFFWWFDQVCKKHNLESCLLPVLHCCTAFFSFVEIREMISNLHFRDFFFHIFFIWLPSELLAVNLSASSPAAPDICLNGGIPSVQL